MIQDFQQTTIASIRLLAEARQLELRRRFCSHICLRESSQVCHCASPAIAIQSKNYTALEAVAVDSYTIVTGL